MAVIKITIVMPYMEFTWHIRTEMLITIHHSFFATSLALVHVGAKI